MANLIITVHPENDSIIELPNLRDGLDDVTTTSTADVTATLYDKRNNMSPVDGLTHITLLPTGTPGTYRGLITDAFNPRLGGGYVLKVDAHDNNGAVHYHKEYDVAVRVNKG